MDFSFVIVNALPQIQPAESIFFWWQIIVIITIGAAYCFDEKDNIYKFKWYDYFVLGFILCAFIFIYYSLNSGLTLISGLLAVYALFYSTMSANYSSRKVVINSWAEKATDHLRQYKDSDLAVKVARMQLVDKPNYFKVRDVLRYRSNKQERAEKNLDVSYADDKLIIKIDGEIIPESEYMVGKKIEWIKIYAKLDIEQYAVELIKKEFEVMAKNGVFTRTKVDDKWKVAKLEGIWLHGANLNETQLQGANLHSAELQGAKLRLAELQGVNLCEAQLQGADLYMAQLQDSYIIDKLMIDVILDEKEEYTEYLPDFDDVILDEKEKYTEYLPDFTGVTDIDSAIFSDDDKGTNKKVIAKIKQMYNL